jgi:hypothetical protein
MEMYTSDLVDLVSKYAKKEKEYRTKKGDYAVNDLLFDMQHEMRKILYKRLCQCFKSVDERCKERKDPIEVKDLYKIVNEL